MAEWLHTSRENSVEADASEVEGLEGRQPYGQLGRQLAWQAVGSKAQLLQPSICWCALGHGFKGCTQAPCMPASNRLPCGVKTSRTGTASCSGKRFVLLPQANTQQIVGRRYCSNKVSGPRCACGKGHCLQCCAGSVYLAAPGLTDQCS